MKKMKKILCLLLAFVLTFGCMSGMAFAETGTKPADGVTEEQPFVTGTGGSGNFRIPCLVTLDDGTIVAGCDARWTTYMDGGGLDTIVSYSRDNGATWNYTFANYLGDNGNVHNGGSTAFIDPAMATDGETVWMIADLYPAGVALNGANHAPQTGHTGYDDNGNLALAAVTDSVNGGSGSADRAAASFDYHLEKIEGAADDAESYYQLKDSEGNAVEGYTIDAFFNIKGDSVDTNLFCADSPYFPYPTDFLYMTSSTDGGATWSIPTLLDVKDVDEQTLLVGPGRGIVTSSGRIVFTAYEFTSGDKFSCTIYSDDGGVTWERGADVSGWSSEAVVTEADGKLYMFTRHGNCYYVSEDEGETWGSPVSVPVPYISTCQLTAITYSEKIDGKTAILFAVPSNTSTRAAGKIYVGLVQEDTTIDWAYEYSINGSDYYAYSCLAELANGTVGLLYENAATQITYVNLLIEDIAAGAAIGDIWFTDAEGPVGTLDIKPGESATFTMEGALEGETLEAVSSNEEAATVTVSDNVVTVEASASVEGLEEVYITVKAGEAETTLKVYVAAAENYEIVELAMGDTVTFIDETGNYAASVDTSTVDTSVAEVTVTGSDGADPDETVIEDATLLLGTTTEFADSEVESSNALFTVAATHNLSATDSDGNTVYLQPYASSNGYPNVTSAVAVTVTATDTENIFYINGNGGYLHFHDGRYDRVQSLSGYETGCSFMLYEAAADGETGSTEIPGFVPVSAVEEGGQYLIVSESSGTYYVMHPTTSTTTLYDQVAKVTGESTDGVATVQLGTSTDFDGDTISASDCLYTYAVSARTVSGSADGTTVYLNLSSAGQPTSTSSENIQITASDYTEGSFELYSTTSSRYLHFHDDTVRFNRCSSNDANHSFEVYKQADTAALDDTITGYVKVTELSEILAGGQFLFARQADDGSYYVLYPSTDTSSVYNYVAKVKNFELAGPSTEIVIAAVEEGRTSVEVNGLTYYINVENEVKDITLEIGESVVLTGDILRMDEAQQVVTVEENKDSAPYAAVDAIVSGEKYLIGNDPYIVINEAVSITNDPDGLVMTSANLAKDDCTQYLWTVTAVDGGYTVQDTEGKYLNFTDTSGSQCVIAVGDTAQTVTITDSSHGGFAITDGTYYFNNFRGDNDNVAGWAGDDNAWYLYQSVGNKITAAAAGTTVITIGGVNYNITVNGEDTPEPATDVTEIFSDVAEGAWYVPYVQYVYDNNIMTGNAGAFLPTEAVTRAMVAETLYKMEGNPEVTDYTEYDQLTDLSRDNWWAASVAWALNTDVATGDTYNMLFNPEASVTREQLATFLYRYANMKGIDTTVSEDASVNDDRISAFALEAFTWAVDAGIISGIQSTDESGNTFYDLAPQSGASRAELAAVLTRFCQN